MCVGKLIAMRPILRRSRRACAGVSRTATAPGPKRSIPRPSFASSSAWATSRSHRRPPARSTISGNQQHLPRGTARSMRGPCSIASKTRRSCAACWSTIDQSVRASARRCSSRATARGRRRADGGASRLGDAQAGRARMSADAAPTSPAGVANSAKPCALTGSSRSGASAPVAAVERPVRRGSRQSQPVPKRWASTRGREGAHHAVPLAPVGRCRRCAASRASPSFADRAARSGARTRPGSRKRTSDFAGCTLASTSRAGRASIEQHRHRVAGPCGIVVGIGRAHRRPMTSLSLHRPAVDEGRYWPRLLPRVSERRHAGEAGRPRTPSRAASHLDGVGAEVAAEHLGRCRVEPAGSTRSAAALQRDGSALFARRARSAHVGKRHRRGGAPPRKSLRGLRLRSLFRNFSRAGVAKNRSRDLDDGCLRFSAAGAHRHHLAARHRLIAGPFNAGSLAVTAERATDARPSRSTAAPRRGSPAC
jgi:hypothetical protein